MVFPSRFWQVTDSAAVCSMSSNTMTKASAYYVVLQLFTVCNCTLCKEKPRITGPLAADTRINISDELGKDMKGCG
jgi:hypothetical protein